MFNKTIRIKNHYLDIICYFNRKKSDIRDAYISGDYCYYDFGLYVDVDDTSKEFVYRETNRLLGLGYHVRIRLRADL